MIPRPVRLQSVVTLREYVDQRLEDEARRNDEHWRLWEVFSAEQVRLMEARLTAMHENTLRQHLQNQTRVIALIATGSMIGTLAASIVAIIALVR